MADQKPNDVVLRIEGELAKAEPLLTTECCIYRVPHEIRKFKDDAYTPNVISIGPFHCGNQRLRNMESHKLLYCKRFLENRAETSLESLVSCVQKSEPNIRRCYSESISVEKFVDVVLVDSCFIFELFLTQDFPVVTLDNGIPFEGWLESCIAYDLLLLENQLPFFILDELYTLAVPSSLNNNRYPPLENLIFNFFGDYNLQLRDPTGSMKHFTDLLRISHLPDALPPRTGQLPKQIYSATQLDEAGVKFRVKNTEGHSLGKKKEKGLSLEVEEKGHSLEVKLISGIPKLKLISGHYIEIPKLKLISRHHLEIPKLEVGDDTEILLRNMMALEQCHYLDKSYITDYVVVLDELINTSNDVDVLVHNGIIQNMLGNNEAVAELFNGICKNIVQTSFNSDYNKISVELENYCKHRWNKAKATLRHDYGSTPWKKAASIGGVVLLFLTVIQTVLSILQVSRA